jgi:hypothetical protein
MLGMLHSLEQDAAQSQRTMANEIGVALGLINACLRHCVRKGYVKVRRIPARRYGYFLTAKGIAEKTRLTVAHLSYSLSFFRQAREDCERAFAHAERQGCRRIAIAGGGELADIAFLCANGRKLELVGLIQPGFGQSTFRGMPVVETVSSLSRVDAVIITDSTAPQQTYDLLVSQLPEERVVPLGILRITPWPQISRRSARVE